MGARTDVTGSVRSTPDASNVLVEAIARALGARRAQLIPKGHPASSDAPGREGRGSRLRRLRRAEAHNLRVEVLTAGGPHDLVLELPRPPTLEDRLIAESLASSLVAPGERAPSGRTPRAAAALEVLRSLGGASDEGPERVLRETLRILRATAGSVAMMSDPPRVWTSGPGRPVLERAAMEAMEGPEGRVEVAGRTFLVRRIHWGGVLLGGFAVEGGTASAELRGCLWVLGAMLRAEIPPPEQEPVADPAGDLVAALSVLRAPAVIVGPDGRLVGMSPDAERLFGLTDFDVGEPAAVRLPALPIEALRRGEPLPPELFISDGCYEPSTVPLPSGARLLVLLDRSREERRRRTQDELLAAMSHELRTPIAGVKALLEVLRLPATVREPERLEMFVSEGVREVSRLERLVEDLLLSARTATGGMNPRPDTIELRPIAEDVVRNLVHRYPDRRFDIVGRASAFADPGLVRHAMWHLFDNAAKFDPSGGAVTIELAEEETGPEIQVSDEGPGIFSGDLARVFEPFQRLEHDTTSQHGGAGVGLYLVKAIVEANGGKVGARSRLGKGSTFSFRLPAGARDS